MNRMSMLLAHLQSYWRFASRTPKLRSESQDPVVRKRERSEGRRLGEDASPEGLTLDGPQPIPDWRTTASIDILNACVI